MRRQFCGLAALTAVAAAPAAAAEYLTELQSEVYQAPGQSQAALAAVAKTCMAQQLAAGVAGGQTIISETPDAIVGRNNVSYADGFMQWQLRSTVSFEVREGRFRISHSRIERFIDANRGWAPVGKWAGSGAKKAETVLQGVSASLAQCAVAPGRKRDEF
jgi:hypothetical protein